MTVTKVMREVLVRTCDFCGKEITDYSSIVIGDGINQQNYHERCRKQMRGKKEGKV